MHKRAQMCYFSVQPQTQTKALGHAVISACGLGSRNYGAKKQVNTIRLLVFSKFSTIKDG